MKDNSNESEQVKFLLAATIQAVINQNNDIGNTPEAVLTHIFEAYPQIVENDPRTHDELLADCLCIYKDNIEV